MKPDEMPKLLKVCALYQRISEEDPEALQNAWFLALDMRMTLDEAIQAVVSLAAENTWISPGSINEKYLAKYRRSHEQGTGRAKLPGQEKPVTRPVPLQVGAPAPVRPQDVPEYVSARKDAWQGETPPQAPSWAIKCPHCGALPGRPCMVQDGNERRPLRHRAAHPAREVAAQVDAARDRVDTTAL